MGETHGEEGSKSGVRPVAVRSEMTRVAHWPLRLIWPGREGNWKLPFPSRHDSGNSLQPEAERRHSERGSAKLQFRMPAHGLKEFAAQGAGLRRRLRCDTHHKSVGAEPSQPSGRPRSWGESRRLRALISLLSSSLWGILMVMSKFSQRGIICDHFPFNSFCLGRRFFFVRDSGQNSNGSGESDVWQAIRMQFCS
jgi:hypothetical protein